MKVVIEMPLGTRIKYEQDKTTGALKIDRVLKMEVPHNYGYVKDSLSGDGDPTDAFVVCDARLQPLSELEFTPKFLIKAIDNGEEDNKYVGYIKDDPYAPVGDQWNVEIEEIKHYLENYKTGFKILEVVEL